MFVLKTGWGRSFAPLPFCARVKGCTIGRQRFTPPRPGFGVALPRPGARVRAAAPLAGRGKAGGLSAPARLSGRLLRPPLTFRAPLVENAKEASP